MNHSKKPLQMNHSKLPLNYKARKILAKLHVKFLADIYFPLFLSIYSLISPPSFLT